jgi:ketosteroid isomerase-like protein
MKNARVLLVVSCTIAATMLVSSFAARTRAQASALQQQVLDMQKKFQDLTVAGDGEGVAALMADDVIFIHGNGAAQSKSEFVTAIKGGQMAFSIYELKDPHVVPFNGGAIVSGLVDLAFKAPPGATTPPRVLHMRGSSVWVQTSAGWKLLLDQDTSIASPPPAAY